MNMPYEPSSNLSAKISRKLLPFRARRALRFNIDKPIVSFTFDDFPRSAIENGARVLEAQNWRASFYVSAGLEGVTNHHGQNFFAKDLKDLQSRGHEIAGHTFSHIDCAQMSVDDVLGETARNIQALKSMGVQGDIEHFAYPFGASSAALKHKLAGRFKTMRGIDAGAHYGRADLNGLRSMGVFSGAKLQQVLGTIEDLKTRPAWLTLFIHDIRENPSEWGCTPAEFLDVVMAAKASGANVLPIGEALKVLERKYG